MSSADERPFHSKDLRKGRTSQVGQVFAITKCVSGRHPVLVRKILSGFVPADVVIGSLREMHRSGRWVCYGFVIMPDHLHFVVKLQRGMLSALVGSFSKYTARTINEALGVKGGFWQTGFYDHALRGEKELSAYLTYMHQNPVRAGLALTPEAWAYRATFPKW